MRPKIGKLLIFSTALLCILAFTLFPQAIATPQTPKVFVVPDLNIFSTETTVVGDTFTVNISTSGWEAPGVFGWQVYVGFDPALLNVTKAFLPADHFLSWLGAGNYFGSASIEEDHVILYCITLVGTEGSTGSGVLATVNFTIIKAPPPTLSCKLELYELSFLDPDGNELVYEVEHGYYEFAPPKAPVYLKVTPEVIGTAIAGTHIRVDVTINELRAEDKLSGVEWKLRFNTSLLQVLDVTEGNFLKSEAEKAAAETGENYATAFAGFHDLDKDFIVGFNFYGKDPWPPEVFPEGSGTLFTVTFNATQMPEELTSTDLTLFDVIMLDVDENEIVYHHLEKGTYIAPAELGDLNYDKKIDIHDLYTWAVSFGSYPSHTRWDARADLNGDGKVNILDGLIIAKAFHTS